MHKQSGYVCLSFSCCVGESTIAAHWHLLIFSWLQINGAPQRGQSFSFMGVNVLSSYYKMVSSRCAFLVLNCIWLMNKPIITIAIATILIVGNVSPYNSHINRAVQPGIILQNALARVTPSLRTL